MRNEFHLGLPLIREKRLFLFVGLPIKRLIGGGNRTEMGRISKKDQSLKQEMKIAMEMGMRIYV